MTFEKKSGTLISVADFWEATGFQTQSEFLRSILKECRAAGLASYEPLRQITKSWSVGSDPSPALEMSKTIALLEEILRLFKSAGTKASADTVNVVLVALKHVPGMEPNMFLEKLRLAFASRRDATDDGSADDTELSVQDYISKLNAAIGSEDSFVALYRRLEADRTMSREDVVQIASSVAFKMAKSTTRKAALARIWEQHEVSESTGAKIRSNDGRSAA